MAGAVEIKVLEKDLAAALAGFFKQLLELEEIRAVLAPLRLPMKNTVRPTLVAEPAYLDQADPLAPSFPLNAARIASRLTRKPIGGHLILVLRPCEIRAFTELVKLKQGQIEEVTIVGLDCLGAYRNTDYTRFFDLCGDDSTARFYRHMLSGTKGDLDGFKPAPACQACGHFTPEGADVMICLLGVDTDHQLPAVGQTTKGRDLLTRLDLPPAEVPASRADVLAGLAAEHGARREAMLAATRAATSNLSLLAGYLSACVNCYNCRAACPVCYCRECVFNTDVFEHEPFQYVKWAQRRGVLKMPTDTLFYHLTRMVHMSTACVGCGQCSNACPNEVPVMELLQLAAVRTQAAFDYQAGRSLEEPPPLSVFGQEEFLELTSGQ
ncbi:MAG: 4Fe-4S binding protein [Thermodesulfobacteriota bacterium]